MESGTDPWDMEYRQRGRLWGGSPPPLPRLSQCSRVLELGCGDGRTTAALAQAGCPVTAIDISSRAAALCRSACTGLGQAEILVASTLAAPFRPGSFDVIMASHIAGHLPVPDRAYLADEVFRLLAPHGRLYFRDFSVSDFRYGRGTEIGPGTFLRKTGIATHYFTAGEVRNLFCGLDLLSLEEHRWEMRIRGIVHPRAEIAAVFRKPE
ncbi:MULTISPECIES: bifunctional 2-polyprenyl-6-hydroxyphenol methylase/3-demethylubiquinol 3-O-methyltransferase UbiG [unclassified Methanoregula]|uniref:class I SAM-dependent methyltransferase n=1 Tax=unclassified Methanoregula TaxID=2649730 RepID=UPI0009C4E7BE|nr:MULTISPECIES: class I SAM-dependent methyltransferase [unclassified Methanoregula]OPX65060.1 MAG: hypothetical protein A4E33_00501 [Methanoregula sp. PtaB.Bin085]OPY32337.1 MAG: hypothetical protein A4E34_02712 [Methanoregula sp. PtaU1.Bin006]